MNSMIYIRKVVFGITQAEMANVADASQATVSRWEKGEQEPDRHQLQRIREEAARRSLPWYDGWFFSVPFNTVSTEAVS